MATYDNNLKLEEITTGQASGQWGDKTNVNLELIGEALSYGTKVGFASDADNTNFALANAPTSDAARAMYLKLTSGASLTQTRVITFADNTLKRVQLIENATSGSQSITLKSGSGGSTVTIPSGQTKMIYFDGGGATNGNVVDVFANFNAGTVNAGLIKASTDTSAGLPAAMGYQAADGLVLTGQGSTNDVTIKNDADGDVIKIPTGTLNFDVAGHNGSVGLQLGGTLVTATAAQINAAAAGGAGVSVGKAIAMALVF